VSATNTFSQALIVFEEPKISLYSMAPIHTSQFDASILLSLVVVVVTQTRC
jgi:hypothetical protein